MKDRTWVIILIAIVMLQLGVILTAIERQKKHSLEDHGFVLITQVQCSKYKQFFDTMVRDNYKHGRWQ